MQALQISSDLLPKAQILFHNDAAKIVWTFIKGHFRQKRSFNCCSLTNPYKSYERSNSKESSRMKRPDEKARYCKQLHPQISKETYSVPKKCLPCILKSCRLKRAASTNPKALRLGSHSPNRQQLQAEQNDHEMVGVHIAVIDLWGGRFHYNRKKSEIKFAVYAKTIPSSSRPGMIRKFF